MCGSGSEYDGELGPSLTSMDVEEQKKEMENTKEHKVHINEIGKTDILENDEITLRNSRRDIEYDDSNSEDSE